MCAKNEWKLNPLVRIALFPTNAFLAAGYGQMNFRSQYYKSSPKENSFFLNRPAPEWVSLHLVQLKKQPFYFFHSGNRK